MCVFNTATTCVCDVRLRHGTAVTCVCNVRQRRAAATQDSNNISLRSGTTPPRWPPLPSRPPPPWAAAAALAAAAKPAAAAVGSSVVLDRLGCVPLVLSSVAVRSGWMVC